MKIKNIDGLSATDLHKRVKEGARFVYFTYTLSLIVLTIRNVSGVYLVRSDENTISKSLFFTVISFLFGWWGIPWGPKHTFDALRSNWKGGKDVTDEVMGVVEGYLLFKDEREEENLNFLK